MSNNVVWVAAKLGAMLVLASVSGPPMAAESNTAGVAIYPAVMFVVSAPQKVLPIFSALQDEKVFKDSDCKKSLDAKYKRDFLKPQNWEHFKYGELLFVECRKPTAETFQLFTQASLKASAESPGRTIKVLTDTITVPNTVTPCQPRYCGLDNSYHQAYPRPKTPCSYCP